MSEYERPTLGSTLMARYIRLGGQLYVGRNNIDSFAEIIAMDHLDRPLANSMQNPGETDAGWVSVMERGYIGVYRASENSGVRITSTGRHITKQVFQEKSPEHRVIGLQE